VLARNVFNHQMFELLRTCEFGFECIFWQRTLRNAISRRDWLTATINVASKDEAVLLAFISEFEKVTQAGLSVLRSQFDGEFGCLTELVMSLKRVPKK